MTSFLPSSSSTAVNIVSSPMPMSNASGVTSASNGAAVLGPLFPPGAAMLRLIQMYDAMSGKGSLNESHILNLSYWKSFVQEFYVPDGFFRQVAWNPIAREQRAFELPVSVLARYLHTVHLSGAVSTAATFNHSREWPPSTLRSIPPPPQTKRSILGHPDARTTHFLQVDRVKITTEYDNGWIVVHTGLLRAGLTPFAGQLKFQFVDFLVTDHESYVSKTKMRRGIAEQALSEDLIAEIRGLPKPSAAKRDGKKDKKDEASNSATTKSDGDEQAAAAATTEEKLPTTRKDDGRFTMPVERWSMPENPVNEYGMTLRSMRCLEITESVCQLRGLMDYAWSHNLGPMDALHRLTEEWRASKAVSRQVTGNGAGSEQVSPDRSHSGSNAGDTSNVSLKRKMPATSTDGVADKVEEAEEKGDPNSPNKRAK